MNDFNQVQMLSLLSELERELARRGQTADIYLVGGAAIALSFDSARTTRDIDAVFAPTSEVRAAVAKLANIRTPDIGDSPGVRFSRVTS